MGNTTSTPPEALTCTYNKREFKQLLVIIEDARNVSEFYGALILKEKLPIILQEYLNYNDYSEEFFNKTRKEVKENLGMSYYQFFNYLTSLKSLYERSDINEHDRKELIIDVFNKAFVVQKRLIEDLYLTCDKPRNIEAPSNPESSESSEPYSESDSRSENSSVTS